MEIKNFFNQSINQSLQMVSCNIYKTQGSIYWKIPPPTRGRVISFYIIWGKNIIRGRVKRGNVRDKGRKGKEKEGNGERKREKGN
jgi:hypothetical protein